MNQKAYICSSVAKGDSVKSVNGKSTVVCSHPVKSGEQLLGFTETTLFQETSEGCSALLASFDVKVKPSDINLTKVKPLVILVNRQIKTDDKNVFRTGDSKESILAELAKAETTFDKKCKLVAKLAKVDPVHPLVQAFSAIFPDVLK